MCVPCEEKRRLNEASQGIVDDGERQRREVQRQVRKGKLTEDQARWILEPRMAADRAYVALGEIASEESDRRHASALKGE